MFNQQIESVSNKLLQFIQDLTANIQTIMNKKILNENFFELFQLRSDYAKQLASLFDILIHRYTEISVLNPTNQIILNLDFVQIWHLIQCCIDRLNNMQSQHLYLIIKHIRTINYYFYNLLLQLKNGEYFKIDQIRILNQNLTEELNHLSESLTHFAIVFYNNSPKMNNVRVQEPSKSVDTYLFQNLPTTQYSDNNNHFITAKSNISPAVNSNCYPCTMSRNLSSQQEPSGDIRSNYGYQTNAIRCPIGMISTVDVFSSYKPTSCGVNSEKSGISSPLCCPTPIVYTPEMEALFASDGIIYVRKSGNTWIAENLGTLIETLKDIGQTIDMNEYFKILVRKTGELVVRRKKGHRKRFLRQTLNTKYTPINNNIYEEMNSNQLYSESSTTNDDQ